MMRVIAAAGQQLVVEYEGDVVRLRPKERMVVASLTLRSPHTLTVGQLIDHVWPGGAPATAQQSIHNHLSRLRSVAPGLVDADGSLFRLAAEVGIDAVPDADSVTGNLLVEFGDVAALDAARRAFFLRHRDPVARSVGVEPGDALIAAAEARAALDKDTGDERAWRTLIAVAAATEGPDAAEAVLRRARDQLDEVGLEPGRRLLDLARRVRDGTTDLAVLRSVEPDASSSNGEGRTAGLRDRLTAVRRVFSDGHPFVVFVNGIDCFARREALATITADARAAGLATISVRPALGGVGPLDTRRANVDGRPILVVSHGVESSAISTVSLGSPPGDMIGHVLAGLPDSSPATQLNAATPERTVRIEVGTHLTDLDRLPDDTPDDTRRLLAALALLGGVAELDEWNSTDERHDQRDWFAAPTALASAQSRLIRTDVATATFELTSPELGSAALASLPSEERRTLVRRLIERDNAKHQSAPHRTDLLTRRAGLLLHVLDDDLPAAVDAALAAGAAHHDDGDFVAAHDVLTRTADAIEQRSGRDEQWCRLAEQVGRARLAGGLGDADAFLRDVIGAAIAADATSIACSASLEWCRLGQAAGAGALDAERLEVLERVLDVATDPVDRSRVATAASMVLSLADRPDALRARFTDAVEAAAEADLDGLWADVSPLAYMSLALHTDAPDRFAHADRLMDIGTRHDARAACWEALQIRYSTELMTGDPAFRTTHAHLRGVGVHDRARQWEMSYIASNIALLDDDLAAARRHIDESLALGDVVHPDRVAAVYGAHLLACAVVDGSAADLLAAVRQLALEHPGIGAWRAAVAVCAAVAGEANEARAALATLTAVDGLDLRRDPTFTAALILAGEAAWRVGTDEHLAALRPELDRLAGMWSWCGSCTFGPIDLTRARCELGAGNTDDAAALAASCIEAAAAMRTPGFARQATEVLLAAHGHDADIAAVLDG